MTKNNHLKNAESPEKVFDTSGIEVSLKQSNLTQPFENTQNNAAPDEPQSAGLDNKADALAHLNGVPVSPSTGTTRTALMQENT